MSRICETFGCTPLEAVRELQNDPERRAESIIELRCYAQTKARIETAEKKSDAPTGPMADWVLRVKTERMVQGGR